MWANSNQTVSPHSFNLASDIYLMSTPTNIKELVNRLVELENENKALKKQNLALKSMNDNGRSLATMLMAKTTKKSTFTNYEIKQAAKDISDALIKKPLIR